MTINITAALHSSAASLLLSCVFQYIVTSRLVKNTRRGEWRKKHQRKVKLKACWCLFQNSWNALRVENPTRSQRSSAETPPTDETETVHETDGNLHNNTVRTSTGLQTMNRKGVKIHSTWLFSDAPLMFASLLVRDGWTSSGLKHCWHYSWCFVWHVSVTELHRHRPLIWITCLNTDSSQGLSQCEENVKKLIYCSECISTHTEAHRSHSDRWLSSGWLLQCRTFQMFWTFTHGTRGGR